MTGIKKYLVYLLLLCHITQGTKLNTAFATDAGISTNDNKYALKAYLDWEILNKKLLNSVHCPQEAKSSPSVANYADIFTNFIYEGKAGAYHIVIPLRLNSNGLLPTLQIID